MADNAGPIDEPDLVARLRAGDAFALDLLLGEYWRPLLRYATRLLRDPDLSQDLVQETFVRLWLRREQLIAGSLRSYLYRVLHNLALDDLRKRRVRQRSILKLLAEVPEAEPEPAPEEERPPVDSAVTQAIDSLPPRRREAFILAYLHHLSYREIAEVMAVSQATVKNQVAAALAQLRDQLRPALASLRQHE